MALIKYAGYDGRFEGRTGYPAGPARTSCPVMRELFRIAEEEKGYSQYQIATALGVGRNTVNNWRHGKRSPDMPSYLEFAKLLGARLRPVIGG